LISIELGLLWSKFDTDQTYHAAAGAGGTMSALTLAIDTRNANPATQRWAYPVLMTLMAVALGVSGAPAPLYGLYEERWHLSPIMTTLVFAAYAIAALAAVLVAGPLSDRYGRRPVLLTAAVTMIVGLAVFMTAHGVAELFFARVLHGAAVGSTDVVGSAALLDLRPAHGARTGHLTGIMFNIGMAVTILSASVLAEFGPDPLVTPYAIVATVVLVLLIGLLAMNETHTDRSSGRLRIARPRVPKAIAHDFRFAALGVMAAWSVLGVYLSLFPSFAELSTGIDHLVFGGAVVAAMAGAAAVSQAFGIWLTPRRAAIVGDVGTAAPLVLSIAALRSHHASLVALVAVLLGLSFGLAFGGSLRHLGGVIPGESRGEVMSAFYVLAYGAMTVPTILAGWAATEWGIATIFPWFAAAVAAACVLAALLASRPERARAPGPQRPAPLL
jgi:MFS family permease